MAIIRTEDFKGVKVPINCSTEGQFSATLPFDDENRVIGSTLDEVVRKIRAAITREQAKKAVEVTMLGCKFTGWEVTRGDEGEAFDAILRGVAERTERLMLTIGGKKVQTDFYRSSRTNIARRLSPKEVGEYKALVKTRNAAQKDLDDFLKAVCIDPRKATEGSTDGK